jgi:hypothetical protein
MKKAGILFHWIPRVLCILAILFVSIFALDAFDPALGMNQQILGFLIHMIPSFVLLLFLTIAWKHERAGGIIFTASGVVLSPLVFNHNYNMNHSIGLSLVIILMITFPFVVVGILFLISYTLKKKKSII